MKSRHGTLPLRVVREFHGFPVVLVAKVPEPGGVGAHGSGRTRYCCNRSVVTRRNRAVSDMYKSLFGKNAPYTHCSVGIADL